MPEILSSEDRSYGRVQIVNNGGSMAVQILQNGDVVSSRPVGNSEEARAAIGDIRDGKFFQPCSSLDCSILVPLGTGFCPRHT